MSFRVLSLDLAPAGLQPAATRCGNGRARPHRRVILQGLFALSPRLVQSGGPSLPGAATLYPPPYSAAHGPEAEIALELALYQPDFAQNAGSALRLGACLGVRVHVIHPTGFPFSLKALRRGGLDYIEQADFLEHDSFAHFDAWRRDSARRLVLLTTKSADSAYAAAFAPADILLIGRESAGVPESVAQTADLRIRIPMRQGMRSLNMATAASLVLGEALRQTGGFETLT
jgi:tRNA (cytidine/uridine-2'-O-)-methyltransferase